MISFQGNIKYTETSTIYIKKCNTYEKYNVYEKVQYLENTAVFMTFEEMGELTETGFYDTLR